MGGMRIAIVFKEWRDSNLKEAHRDDMANGLFSPGAIFNGTIFLEKEDEEELLWAMERGYYPVVVLNRP